MPADAAELPWTDEQWAAVQRIVQETASKARVASSFLPLVGPLPPGQASVPALWMKEGPTDGLRGEAPERLEINDAETLALATISCKVYLTTQQAQDPELASAHQMLRRAADIIGRVEDAIVFRGQPGPHEWPTQDRSKKKADPLVLPKIYGVQGGDKYPALLDESGLPAGVAPPFYAEKDLEKQNDEYTGASLIDAIVSAVQTLERNGHHGPFACVLGRALYDAANTPDTGSLVLPSDRFTPFLEGGPLRRSSLVDPDDGIVVSLAGSPIDLVVASDVHVNFLQLSLEPRYVLRVSERVVLRMKQPTAICHLKKKT
jgi:uncharacterized linocin/CFP29 family protein